MEDSQMEVTKRHDRSLSMALLQKCIRPFGPRLIKPGKPLPTGSPKLKPSPRKRDCRIEERFVEETWLYDVTCKQNIIDSGGKSLRRRIYYFAGGGFQSPASPQHWSFVQELARRVPSIVTLVSYPLAPHSPGKDSIPHLSRLYLTLMLESTANGERVTFMGDSAGGNVVLSLILHILKQGGKEGPVPHSIFVVSPCVDARNSNPQMKDVEPNDPILRVDFTGDVAAKWALGTDRSDPIVSPLLDDLEILATRNVRLDGVVGTYDVLAPDALLLLKKAQTAQLRGKWLVWERQMHCFPLAWRYGLSDSVQAKDWIVQTLQQKW